MPNIRVDEDVYDFLKGRAEPFTDTPNSVLRRILGLDGEVARDAEGTEPATEPQLGPARGSATGSRRRKGKKQQARRGKKAKRTRAPSGLLLPLEDYFDTIIDVLRDQGGQAAARDVIAAVGDRLSDRLTSADKEPIESGLIRWQNRVQFARHRLVEAGRISKTSPRGVWALSPNGDGSR